ncbi:MAG TPA: ATP-binding protein [Anaerolineales bacterium]|jgi:signal transduction histidine kinase
MTGPLVPSGSLTYGSELNAVYAIARIVAETYDTEAGLDAVVRLARTIFIFDVVSLYLHSEETDDLEAIYARALGRGRARESELPWGEQAAREAYRSGQTVLRQEDTGPSIEGRDRRRDYLGLPMMVGGRCVGGLVFGRFGGPAYPPEHIRLAEFVAWHVGQLLENRRMARRIASLEAQRELARMQEEFISTISHELRTPLGFIKGYTTTLLRDDASWDPNTRSEFLQIIDDEADRLRELIDNLLDSSRLESGSLGMTREPTLVSSLIRDSMSRANSIYPNLQLKPEFDDNLPSVQLDSTRIAQVLDNLISNASKYAPEAPVAVRAKIVDSQLQIEVEDQGPGIAPDHMAHLFERFYRVPDSSRSVRGTGLGLYICRKIVEAHDGDIGVDSVPGRGTRFHFRIPLVPADVPEPQEEI